MRRVSLFKLTNKSINNFCWFNSNHLPTPGSSKV